MEAIWSSFSKWFNEKTASPLYFTYIGFFIMWNWKFFQIIFIEDSSLFTHPKIEYIYENLYLNLYTTKIPFWLINIFETIINIGWHLIPPAIFTILAILYLPKAQKWALKKHLDTLFERKRIFETKQREYSKWLLDSEKDKRDTLEQIAEVKKDQEEQKEIIEKASSPEEKWESEYQQMKYHPLFSNLELLIHAVYKNGGRTHEILNNQWQKLINPALLAFADTRGLIKLEGSGSQEKISFTEKGKFIISRYLEEK